MIAVCDLFFAPIGIASGGGHGSSMIKFEMSGALPGVEEGSFGWFCLPADFFAGCSICSGGFAEPYVSVPGVKSSGLYDGIVPSHTTKLPFGSVS